MEHGAGGKGQGARGKRQGGKEEWARGTGAWSKEQGAWSRVKEESGCQILNKSLPAHWRERSVSQPVDRVVCDQGITLRRHAALHIRKPPKVITGGCN